MSRYGAKVDGNQPAIVKVLRALGASVQSLHIVGKGCPDLLIGWHGRNLLAEVKDGALSKSRQSLTVDEAEWHAGWHGQIVIVRSVPEALRLLSLGGGI